MSRSRREPKIPKWALNHRASRHTHFQANAPSTFREMWRRQMRARSRNVMQSCRDFSEVQIVTKIQKVTSIYDWY